MPTLLPIRAYGFAATFRLRELEAVVIQGGRAEVHKDPDRDRLIIRFPPRGQGERLAILFDFGAVVCCALDAEEREHLIRDITAHLSPEPHAPLTEEFLIELRPGATIDVQFDRIVVPEATLPILDIIGLLLAQSVAMDYYEEDVQEILKRTEAINTTLQNTGRLPGRVSDLVKFIGTCIVTKNAVIAALSLFDKPDSAWDNRDLDRLYNALRLELEIDDRFRALEAKLRMIQENSVILVDLSRHRSTWLLELTVVLLILFEVVIMLWQMFRGGGH